MHRTFVLALAAVLIIAACGRQSIAVPVTTKIGFEGYAAPGKATEFIRGAFYNEADYKLFFNNCQILDSALPGVGIEFPSNGTDWALENNTLPIGVSQINSVPFYLLSFDATEYNWSQPGHSPIRVTGTTIDGTQLTFNSFTANKPQPATPQFQTFSMPAEWFNQPFVMVTIGAPSRGFAIDNIMLRTVPEPSTFALAALGALGLLIAARRKR